MPPPRLSAALLPAALLGAALAAQPVSADPAACDPGETTIIFSHVTAVRGHPKGEAAEELRRRVNEALEGRACMEVYPNSTLYKDDEEMFQAMLDGKVHLAAPSISKMSGLAPEFQLFDLPFLFRDLEAVIDFQYTPEAQKLLHAADGKGYIGLAYWMNGMKQYSADRPLVKPADAAGLSFRMQGSPVEAATLALLDAAGEKIAFKDVHDALASGRVNGQDNTWANIYTKKFHEVQHSVTQTDHGVLAYILMTSKTFMDGLDPALRADFTHVLAEVTHERNRFAHQLADVNRMKLLEAGGRMKRLRPAQREAWVETLKPVWDQFAPQIGLDLIRAAEGKPTEG